ncbi:hypothetical protein MRB53_026163 [Persea americana]|uniref:Uncharacterized protein n=1 Tax=Persea americana TaxID=3435 RepID=A0ACC2LHF1_PERAE|nr:hypothetical protein MRB53_026163 [Persea americana]
MLLCLHLSLSRRSKVFLFSLGLQLSPEPASSLHVAFVSPCPGLFVSFPLLPWSPALSTASKLSARRLRLSLSRRSKVFLFSLGLQLSPEPASSLHVAFVSPCPGLFVSFPLLPWSPALSTASKLSARRLRLSLSRRSKVFLFSLGLQLSPELGSSLHVAFLSPCPGLFVSFPLLPWSPALSTANKLSTRRLRLSLSRRSKVFLFSLGLQLSPEPATSLHVAFVSHYPGDRKFSSSPLVSSSLHVRRSATSRPARSPSLQVIKSFFCAAFVSCSLHVRQSATPGPAHPPSLRRSTGLGKASMLKRMFSRSCMHIVNGDDVEAGE